MDVSASSFRKAPVTVDAVATTERLPGVRPKVAHPTRAQRTRRTVDLTPATHRALDIWQREAADRLGLARVTGQEVLCALIEQLLSDPKLSAEVIQIIGEGR
jgi:hypothetical protein